MKEVIFHCGRYPELTLTVKPFGMKDKHGTKEPAKHLHFRPDTEFGAGILRIQDEEMVKFVRENEYFKSGKIIDITGAKEHKPLNLAKALNSGTLDSGSVKLPAGAPVEGKRAIKAAKVPGKK